MERKLFVLVRSKESAFICGGKRESARSKTIKKELEWLRENPKARRGKSKARISRFEELSSHEYQKRNETQEIFIPVAERLGNDVIQLNNISKATTVNLFLTKLILPFRQELLSA